MLDLDKQLKNSQLFQNAMQSKLRPSALLALVIFFALWGISLLVGRMIVTPLIELLPSDTPIQVAIAAALRKILVCGIQIAAFLAWARGVEKRSIFSLGFGGAHKIKAYVGSAVLGFGAISAIVISLLLLGAIKLHISSSLSVNSVLIPVIIAISGWMIQSASEEIAIRGWLIPLLGIRYGPLAAVLITGCAFGAIHLFNNGATFLSFFNLILSGIFFALYAIRAGNIWGVCGLHMGWNFAQGNIYGVNISGEHSSNAVFTCETTGSNLLTGGDFGPEAGLITTVLLIFCIFAIGIIIFKKCQADR